MLRPIYSTLVQLHPPAFRQNYGPEMLSIFDHTPAGNRAALLGDAAASLFRQWLFRPEFHQPDAPASKPAIAGSMFLLVSDHPRLAPSQWIAGAALSFLMWTAAAALVGSMAIHLPVALSMWAATGDDTRFLAQYFDSVRVLNAIDLNRDFVISAPEIANAPRALLLLDKNFNGSIEPRECFLKMAGPDEPTDFMSSHPALAALDSNHDGVISAEEIAHSAAALLSLDTNHDGELSPDEYLPR